jgi:hypothetical protein
VGRQLGELQAANRRAYVAYAQLKDAARRYLDEQIGVALAVREAQDAGLDTEHWVSWLDMPGERAVIEARIEAEREEDVAEEHEREVNAVMNKLRKAGYEPLRPENIVVEGGAS